MTEETRNNNNSAPGVSEYRLDDTIGNIRKRIGYYLDFLKSSISGQPQNRISESPKKQIPQLTPEVISQIIGTNKYTTKHLFQQGEVVKKAAEAIGFLVNRHGFSKEVATGIVANTIAENRLRTETTKGGLGICQWIGSRAETYRKVYDTLPGSDELQKQLSYIVWELHNDRVLQKKGTFNALKSASTAADAASIFLTQYERPKVLNTSERVSIAQGIMPLTQYV